ncbi:MAG: hypothetical protein QM690_03950 [Sphingobium sp.]
MTGQSVPAERRRSYASQNIEPEIVHAMRHLVTGRTDEQLTVRFGISYNSWRKIMAGEPVRPSLARRLEERVRRLQRGEGRD